jgi:hypothetical protein
MVYNFFIFIFSLIETASFGAESNYSYFLIDTANIISTGKQNLIIVDSVMIVSDTSNTLALPFPGKLTQTGQANQIEIYTNPGNNPDNSKSKIIINQTGNNNKVKINSQ